MRRWIFLFLSVSACFYEETRQLPADFATCAVADDGTAGVAAPTWYRDVEPIVIEKCQGCHVDGGIAPFAIGYSEMVALRDEITDAVTTGRMPPWQPSGCCNHYKYDRSLTDAERDTLVRWIAGGEPDGDPADEQPVAPPPLGLPRVDLHAEMPVAFAPRPTNGLGNNELRCFLLDHDPIETTRYVTGFDFVPGVRAEVHHMIAMTVPEGDVAGLEALDGADGRPGWDCRGQGSELTSDVHFIGGWQPGVLAKVLPDGVGRELPAHSRIYVQIHYDAGHGELPDLSSLDLMLADHVDKIEKGVPLGNPLWFVGDGMQIDAGDPDASVWFAYDPTILSGGKPIDVQNVMLHMHELGSKGRLALLHPDGTAECLLDIPQWDFHWLSDYDLDAPVRVNPGDQLYVECHWDNSAAHQPLVDGEPQAPRTLHWGTDQEMCGGIFTYYEAL